MKSVKPGKDADNYFEMEFSIDSELRETTVTSVTVENLEIIAKENFSHENSEGSLNHSYDYTVDKRSLMANNSVGDFLLCFIQADFSKVEGFSKFAKTWGISGLLDINPLFDYPLISKGQHFSYDELKKLHLKYFEGTHTHLIEAQHEFKEVIDYCTDVTERPFLEPLKPNQRYYLGSLKKDIPSLDKYSAPLRIIFNIHPKSKNKSSNLSNSSLSTERLAREIAIENITLNTSYYGNDLRTFLYLEFFTLINELLLKKCSNCGDYFIAKHKINEIYCENCRNVSYGEKIKKDPLQKAYHTAYKTRHREKQRKLQESPDNKDWIEQWDGLLKKWVINAKEQLELARDERITYEQFIRSLNVTLSELGGV